MNPPGISARHLSCNVAARRLVQTDARPGRVRPRPRSGTRASSRRWWWRAWIGWSHAHRSGRVRSTARLSRHSTQTAWGWRLTHRELWVPRPHRCWSGSSAGRLRSLWPWSVTWSHARPRSRAAAGSNHARGCPAGSTGPSHAKNSARRRALRRMLLLRRLWLAVHGICLRPIHPEQAGCFAGGKGKVRGRWRHRGIGERSLIALRGLLWVMHGSCELSWAAEIYRRAADNTGLQLATMRVMRYERAWSQHMCTGYWRWWKLTEETFWGINVKWHYAELYLDVHFSLLYIKNFTKLCGVISYYCIRQNQVLIKLSSDFISCYNFDVKKSFCFNCCFRTKSLSCRFMYWDRHHAYCTHLESFRFSSRITFFKNKLFITIIAP